MPSLILEDKGKGPQLTLYVGLSAPRTQKSAIRSHAPLPVAAIVDTGASITCIDREIIQILGLEPIDTAPVLTISTDGKPEEFQIFDVSIRFESDGKKKEFKAHRAVTASFYKSEIQALIGRDILDSGIFKYDGFEKSYSLCFSRPVSASV